MKAERSMIIISGLLLIACAILPWFLKGPQTDVNVGAHLANVRHPKVHRAEPTVSVAIPAPTSSVSGLPSTGVNAAKASFRSVPTAGALRAAVASDHHSTPRILHALAYEMAREMSAAKQNTKVALALFRRLHACALDKSHDSLPVVKAVCAQNAQVLARLFPNQLAHRFSQLTATLDQRVHAMLWK